MRKLKSLQYLNLAMNNVTCIENLEKCESLSKLDLTMNFISLRGLMSVKTLAVNHSLRQLFLMGNPCAEFQGYRSFIIGTLPQLTHLDGTDVTHAEKIVARHHLSRITQELEKAIEAESESIMSVDDVAALAPEERPWCSATRILESDFKESVSLKALRSRETKESFQTKSSFDALPEDIADVKQKNQGDFKFQLTESDDDASIKLEVQVGAFIDTSLILVDVQPTLVRVKIKSELLQLKLPSEVATDASTAERSKATGKLLITMPKLNWHVKPKVLKKKMKPTENRARVTYHGSDDDEPPGI